MNARRCYVSVAVLGETIYAMGGYDGHHRQNTAERFNHRTNQWSLVAPMNAQRSDASAAALDSIYTRFVTDFMFIKIILEHTIILQTKPPLVKRFRYW